MTTIHCSSNCKHPNNGICDKKDVIMKQYKLEYKDQYLGKERIEIVDSYVYCCHYEEA